MKTFLVLCIYVAVLKYRPSVIRERFYRLSWSVVPYLKYSEVDNTIQGCKAWTHAAGVEVSLIQEAVREIKHRRS